MEIAAKKVSELRVVTGAGMMDCKKALMEAHGDFEKAIELLRKKGQKVSASRSDKAINEGGVFIQSSSDHTKAVLIALNCETDFVVKNDLFQNLGNEIARIALERNLSSKETLLNTKIDQFTVADKITELMGKVGERIAISQLIYKQGEPITSYTHMGNKLGVLVCLKGGHDKSLAMEAGRNIGMQIAAMNPLAIDEHAMDMSLVDKERTVIQSQILAEGKPEHMVEKIAHGKMKKFYKDNTLLNQVFVRDNTKTVAQYLDSVAQGLTVADFCRVSIG